MRKAKVEIATWMLLWSALGLYLINGLMHLLIWKISAVDFFLQFLCPILIAGAFYEWGWLGHIYAWAMRPSTTPLLSTVILASSTALLTLFIDQWYSYSFFSACLPLFTLSQIGYIWGKKSRGGLSAVLYSGVLFLFIATFSSKNVMRLLTLIIGTLLLILHYPSHSSLYGGTVGWKDSIRTAVIFIVLSIFLFLQPVIRSTLTFAAISINGHTEIDQCCQNILFSAYPFGQLLDILFPEGFFDAGREYALLLAILGLVPWSFVVLLTLLMGVSAIYLTYHEYSFQNFYNVSACLLLSIQTFGSLLSSLGMDGFRFSSATPLLGSGWENGLYILLIISLVLPKQSFKPQYPENDSTYEEGE